MSKQIWSGLFGIVVIVVLSACAPPPKFEPPYQDTVSIHDFMYWVLEPAADGIWDSAGFVMTEAGEQDLQPTTQEGWDKVRNSATLVAEAGNLLMLPVYRADNEDWVEYAEGLITTGLSAREAALNKDADALFEAGGAIYNVCRACHSKYVVAE